MKVFLNRPRTGIAAVGEYDKTTKSLIVKKGSVISTDISKSARFRGAKAIENARTGNVKDNIVLKDITFSSASTAANFVTGSSTNGLIAWKDENGMALKKVLES